MDSRMNKLYEQWKRVLASPRLLTAFSIVSLIGLYLLLSLIFKFVYTVIAFASYLIQYGFVGMKQVGQALFSKFGSHFIGQLFLHSEHPLVEGVVFILAYSFLLFKLVPRLYKMRVSYKDINKGTKGTARWMQEEEMKRTYEIFDINSDEFQLEFDGFPVSMLPDRQTMLVETDNTNLKVVGTSQAARKTQLIFYWMLYLNAMAKNPSSGLVNDLKGDMLMKWLGNPNADRFDNYALNFNEPSNSIKYNPFMVVWKYLQQEKNDDAEIALQGIAKMLFSRENNQDEDFVAGASATFTAISLVLAQFAKKYNQPQWFTFAGMYDLQLNYNRPIIVEETEYKPLDEYMKSQPSDSSIAKYYMTATSATKKQVQSFYFLLSTTLKDFAMRSILELTSSSDLDFEQMAFPDEGQKPIMVFVASPYVNNVFEKIQGLFYTQYLEVITKKASKTPGQKLKRRNRVYLDEIQNSTRIGGLSEAMNVGQQMGLLFALGIQSYSGFEEKYPGKEGDAILKAAPGTVYLISDSGDDAQEMSDRLGKATVVGYNRIGSPLDLDKSITEQEEERPLLLKDEIMRLAQDEALYTNVKKRLDKNGEDVVPNPIYARKKRLVKLRNIPGEPKWKKVFGFAKQEEETKFEPYMELIPAFAHLFKGEKHEFFDDKGLGTEDIDFRREVPKDEYGTEIPFDVERHIVPHELVDLTFKMWANRENEEYLAMEKFEDERKLKILEQQIKEGTYYSKKAQKTPLVDEVPQELSDEFIKEPIEIPQTAPQASPEHPQVEVNFDADTLVTEALGEDYDKIFQFLNEKQAEVFKERIKTLGELNDRIMLSEKVTAENKKGIEDLLSHAYARLMGKEKDVRNR